MKILIAGAIVALSLSAGMSSAGEPAADSRAKNCDQRMEHRKDRPPLTPEQRKKKSDKMFSSMDADKDGAISRAEFDKHHDSMHARRQQRRAGGDKDQDAAK